MVIQISGGSRTKTQLMRINTSYAKIDASFTHNKPTNGHYKPWGTKKKGDNDLFKRKNFLYQQI